MKATMMRTIFVLVACAAGAVPAAAQEDARADRRDAALERRAELERRVLHRFMTNAAPAVEMTPEQLARVRAILEESARRNRERMLTGMRLRRELAEAVRSEDTAESEFTRLLQEIERVRAAEHDAWQADQRAIADVLAPRQRAEFALRWLRFQENVRAMIGARRRGRGTPGRSPG